MFKVRLRTRLQGLRTRIHAFSVAAVAIWLCMFVGPVWSFCLFVVGPLRSPLLLLLFPCSVPLLSVASLSVFLSGGSLFVLLFVPCAAVAFSCAACAVCVCVLSGVWLCNWVPYRP